MITYVSEYGKRWDARVPRSAISWLVARFHVGLPDSELEREIRERCKRRYGFTERLIAQSVAYAVECHKRNQRLYRDVMSGRI